MTVDTHSAVFLDVSGLPPPEPMEHILEALASLAPAAALQVLIDREPHPLLRILEREAYHYAIGVRDDGRVDLTIRKAPCSGR